MSNQKSGLIQVEDLRLIWKLLITNWYLFIIIPAIAGAIAYYKAHKLTDI